MSASRGILGLIWAAVHKLPDGEECLRAAVERINDRDQTNQQHKGASEYRSTKLLNFQQLQELANEFRRRAQLPRKKPAAPGPRGGRPRRPAGTDPERVSYLATQAERDYIEYLFDLLTWSEEARLNFILRQTKQAAILSHRDATAVSAPLERMLRGRGFTLTQTGRSKKWTALEVPHENVDEGLANRPPDGSGRT
jgi:hypothetical protein